MTKASGAPTPRKEAFTTDLRSCCHTSVVRTHARPGRSRRRTAVTGRRRFAGALGSSALPAWASPLRQLSLVLKAARHDLPLRNSWPTGASRQPPRPPCASAAALGMQPLTGDRDHIRC